YRWPQDAAGAGEFRGGLGVEFQVRLLRGSAVSSVIGDRGKFPPFGLQGGAPGAPAIVEYKLGGKPYRAPPSYAKQTPGGKPYRPPHLTKDEGILMQEGDVVTIATPGGGGWGDPS